MSPVPGGPVVVVGGGAQGPGRAVTAALLADGARVIVPVRTEAEGERFYLEADPAAVPRLRTAVGEPDDPALTDRIAAVARREFGGVDHVVALMPPPDLGALDALDAREVKRAVDEGLAAPAALVLGLLRHLTGAAPVKRVIAVTPPPGVAGPPDAAALARTFLEALVGLLDSARRPGLAYHVVTPRGGDAGELARTVVRLLATGDARAASAPDDRY